MLNTMHKIRFNCVYAPMPEDSNYFRRPIADSSTVPRYILVRENMPVRGLGVDTGPIAQIYMWIWSNTRLNALYIKYSYHFRYLCFKTSSFLVNTSRFGRVNVHFSIKYVKDWRAFKCTLSHPKRDEINKKRFWNVNIVKKVARSTLDCKW
jgi:hypothetical protein